MLCISDSHLENLYKYITEFILIYFDEPSTELIQTSTKLASLFYTSYLLTSLLWNRKILFKTLLFEYYFHYYWNRTLGLKVNPFGFFMYKNPKMRTQNSIAIYSTCYIFMCFISVNPGPFQVL